MTAVQETQSGWVPPAQTFSARLALVRNYLGLNIKQAATKAEVDPSSWNQWEKGRLPRDLVAEVRKISEALGCDFIWLLTGSTEGREPTVPYIGPYLNLAYPGVTSPPRDVVGFIPAA